MLNIDDRLLEKLNESEMFLCMNILKYMQTNRMTAWPSLETLSKSCRWDERTTKKWRQSLFDKGVIKIVEQPGKSNIYSFAWDGFGVWTPAKNVEMSEIQGGAINVPPTKNAGAQNVVEGGHKMYPELINKELVNNIKDMSGKPDGTEVLPVEEKKKKENPHPVYQVEVFEPVKTETVAVEQPRVKLLMPKYDLKKHPLPELEAQRKKLLEQYNDPKTPIHNRAAIEATGKKVAALIQTEKQIDAAILLLNEKAGFTYRLNTPATRKAIKNRLEEYPLENLILVIEHKCKEWADDEKMRQYLRPETLFNGHFESYYQAALIAKKPSKKQNETVYTAPVKRFGQ